MLLGILANICLLQIFVLMPKKINKPFEKSCFLPIGSCQRELNCDKERQAMPLHLMHGAATCEEKKRYDSFSVEPIV